MFIVPDVKATLKLQQDRRSEVVALCAQYGRCCICKKRSDRVTNGVTQVYCSECYPKVQAAVKHMQERVARLKEEEQAMSLLNSGAYI